MRRVQFIELHEQPWVPSSLRDEITDALQFGLNLAKAYAPIAPLLRGVLDSAGSCSVVDLCSGGGGPWLELSRELQSRKVQGGAPGLHISHISLSDKYPNLRALESAGVPSENLTYYPSSVPAMNVPAELKGFQTLFTSFHLFSPEDAR